MVLHGNKLINHTWTNVANWYFFDHDETLMPWWISLDYDPLFLFLSTWDQDLIKSILHNLIQGRVSRNPNCQCLAFYSWSTMLENQEPNAMLMRWYANEWDNRLGWKLGYDKWYVLRCEFYHHNIHEKINNVDFNNIDRIKLEIYSIIYLYTYNPTNLGEKHGKWINLLKTAHILIKKWSYSLTSSSNYSVCQWDPVWKPLKRKVLDAETL